MRKYIVMIVMVLTLGVIAGCSSLSNLFGSGSPQSQQLQQDLTMLETVLKGQATADVVSYLCKNKDRIQKEVTGTAAENLFNWGAVCK